MFIAHLSSVDGSPRHENVVFGALMCNTQLHVVITELVKQHLLYHQTKLI
jgi:hypothetical protein